MARILFVAYRVTSHGVIKRHLIGVWRHQNGMAKPYGVAEKRQQAVCRIDGNGNGSRYTAIICVCSAQTTWHELANARITCYVPRRNPPPHLIPPRITLAALATGGARDGSSAQLRTGIDAARTRGISSAYRNSVSISNIMNVA